MKIVYSFSLDAHSHKIVALVFLEESFGTYLLFIGGQEAAVALEILTKLARVGSVPLLVGLAHGNLNDFIFSRGEFAALAHLVSEGLERAGANVSE
jgi:hypothetical protein